jgi:signal transduction histidine kinase
MHRSLTLLQPLVHKHGAAKSAAFLIIAFAVLAVSLSYFVLSYGRPFMGIEMAVTDGAWTIQGVDPNGAAGQAGITAGDIPVTINGETAAAFLEKQKQASAISGLSITDITVSDDGRLKTASLDGAEQSKDSLVEYFSLLFVSIVFWATGFYTFFKRPENRASFIFCLCGLAFGILVSSTIAKDCLIPGASWLTAVSMIAAPWILFHFFLVLPEERKWGRATPTSYAIYVFPILTVILFFAAGSAYGQVTPWFNLLRLISIGLAFTGTAVTAVINYAGAASIRTRQQMKIILLGSLGALIPFLLLYLIPKIIWKQSVLPPGINVLFLGILPAGMAYAIVTQRLMDIDIVIRRSLVYGLVTLLMVAVLSTVIFLLLGYAAPLGDRGKFLIAISLSIIAMILVGPVKGRIELLVDRLFYKDRYDYRQIIRSLNTSLNTMTESYEMSRLIVGTAVNTLNLAGGCLLVRNQYDELEVSATQGVFSDIEKKDTVMSLTFERNKAIEFPNTASAVYPDIEYLIPLRAVDREVGILCVAGKASRQEFSSDDLLLLEGIASTTALSLHRAMLIREVSMRDTFVSIASHELRTPLSAVLGYADLMARKNLPEETRTQFVRGIIEAGDRIASILDDLLNVSRIQTGRVVFRKDNIDVPALAKERAKFFKETTDRHEIAFETEEGIPPLTADREKLGQIIDNLMTNAIKYSPKGGPITVATRYDGGRKAVIISVADKGMGISEADQQELFTTFHRIQRPETQGIPGTGLGLYIAKEWTEAMGGKIRLESELNEGSVFRLEFPITVYS